MIPGGDAPTQRRVGAVMLGAILLAAVFVVAILPRVDLAGGYRIEVGFVHVGALRAGAPIIVAGRTVGKVESILLIDPDDVVPGHPLAATGGAIAHVRIANQYRHMVPDNGEFFISSKGVLSDRYLEVGPPRDRSPAGPPLAPGAFVLGVDPPSLDRALQRTWDNLVESRAFLDAIEPEVALVRDRLLALADTLEAVAPNPGAYADLALRLRALVGEATELRDTLAAAGADPAALSALAARARATIAHTRTAVATLRTAADRLVVDLDRARTAIARRAPDLERLRRALDEAETLLARTDRLAARAQELLAIVERGDGSLLKLARDPEFPEDAKDLGKVLKRNPWRVLGRPADATSLPPRAPRRSQP